MKRSLWQRHSQFFTSRGKAGERGRSKRRTAKLFGLTLIFAVALLVGGLSVQKPLEFPRPELPRAPGIQVWNDWASWYGHPFHGRRMANEEIFDKEKLTAAHRTLPFGTVIRATNLKDPSCEIVVPVTDRGPFPVWRGVRYYRGWRGFDFSEAAMRKLCGLRDGVIAVRIAVLEFPANE